MRHYHYIEHDGDGERGGWPWEFDLFVSRLASDRAGELPHPDRRALILPRVMFGKAEGVSLRFCPLMSLGLLLSQLFCD